MLRISTQITMILAGIIGFYSVQAQSNERDHIHDFSVSDRIWQEVLLLYIEDRIDTLWTIYDQEYQSLPEDNYAKWRMAAWASITAFSEDYLARNDSFWQKLDLEYEKKEHLSPSELMELFLVRSFLTGGVGFKEDHRTELALLYNEADGQIPEPILFLYYYSHLSKINFRHRNGFSISAR